MCEAISATTLLYVSLAATAAGTAVSVMAAQQQAAAQSASLKYQAQVAENNAKIAGVQGDLSREAGQAQEQAQRQKTAALISHSRAVAGASGTDPNSGSNLDLLESEAQTGELDALTIRSNTARTVYGYEVAGMSDRAQAGLDMAGAGFANAQGNWAMFNSVLSGASSLADKWGGWQNQSRLTEALSRAPAVR